MAKGRSSNEIVDDSGKPKFGEWISVKDRLPEIPKGYYGVSVLVAEFDPCYEEINPGRGYTVTSCIYGSTRDRNGNKIGFYDGVDLEFDFKQMYIGNGECTWGPFDDEITHWMYMPEPPKKEK